MKLINQGKLVLLTLSAAVLSACGGGGGDSGSGPVTPSTTTVTVSPSLGKFSAGAIVRLKNLQGNLIGSGTTTATGTASINIGSYSGVLIVEVVGATGVTYFDEGSRVAKPFGPADILRAIAPAVQTAIGVTPATNAAVKAIELANGNSIPANITTTSIQIANNKIAAALGISNILVAPKLVESSTSGLEVVNVSDQYAIKLAALAKLATTNKTALDVANDLAKDLSDDKWDGQYAPTGGGAPELNTATTYTGTTISADMAAATKSAANDLATADSKSLINSDPTIIGAITPDTSKVTAPSPAIVLAKAMFAELRTTFSSLGKGFLNDQALRISDDVKASVPSAMDRVFSRLEVLGGDGVKLLQAAGDGTARNGVVSGTAFFGGSVFGDAWILQRGSVAQVLNGTGGLTYCYALKSNTSKATCLTAARDSADPATGKVRMLRFEITKTADKYEYTVVRENRSYQPNASQLGAAESVTVEACGSGCTGTITVAASTVGFTGTLPPSTSSTGADAVNLAAEKLTLPTANHYRLNLSGSISTSNKDSNGKEYKTGIALESGSYLEIDLTNEATGNSKPVGVNLVGATTVNNTKLTGTLSLKNFVNDISKTEHVPTTVSFSGTIADLSTAGAGTFLTGKLDALIEGFSTYNATLLRTANNTASSKVTFTGTIQAPSRPLMTLVLSGTSNGITDTNVTLNYRYGIVSIIGSGTISPTGQQSYKISNQDGITMSPNVSNPNNLELTKGDEALASIVSGVINYRDGTSESYN